MASVGDLAINGKKNLGVLVEENDGTWKGVSLEKGRVGKSWSSSNPTVLGHVSQLRDLISDDFLSQ